MTREAVHRRRVEANLMHIQPEGRLGVVKSHQRRLNAVRVFALVLWMACPAGLNIVDQAVNTRLLGDLLSNNGVAVQAQDTLRILQGLMTALAFFLKLGVRGVP